MSRKFKIAIVQGAFLPVPTVLGGAVEKLWFTMGQEFSARGHDLVHISRRYSNFPDKEEIEGVQHFRVKGYDAPKNAILYKILDLFYSLRCIKVIAQSDIIITNTFFLPILLRFFKRGQVYVSFERFPKGQAILYSKAARLRTPSTAVLRAIMEQSPSLKPLLKCIPNFLPQAFCNLQIDTVKIRERKFVFIGRIHPEKGISLLVELANKLQFELCIIGPHAIKSGGGGEAYLSALKERAADNVSFEGPIYEDSVLIEYLSNAHAFIYPSLAEKGESFGLAPLEAMACGAIPVVSSLECFRDFIEEGVHGFYFDHNADFPVDALCDQLRVLLSMGASRISEMREECIQQAGKFSSNKIADKFIEDFEEICLA